MIFLADGIDGLQLRLMVEGAGLRRLGKIDHAGLDDVLVEGIIVPDAIGLLQPPGGELAVFPGDGQHLMAGALDGAGFVAVDVAGVYGKNALPGPQQGIDHGGIGLRSANHEMHARAGQAAGGADFIGRGGAVGVGAIAQRLVQIGLLQPLQNGGMSPLQIIAVKTDHNGLLQSDESLLIVTKTPALCKRRRKTLQRLPPLI